MNPAIFLDPETWVAIAFIIFVGVVLYYKLPQKIGRALDQRSGTIARELEEARKLRVEAEALLADYKQRAENAQVEAEEILAQAEREGLPPKQLDQAALDRMRRYRWPGNVRELENLARRLSALYPQEMINAAVIEAELNQPPVTVAGEESDTEQNLASAVERYLSRYFSGFDNALPPPGLYHRVLREVEYPLLSAALAATRGNQIRAADLLGVNRNTLRKKIRDLEVRVIRSSG